MTTHPTRQALVKFLAAAGIGLTLSIGPANADPKADSTLLVYTVQLPVSKVTKWTETLRRHQKQVRAETNCAGAGCSDWQRAVAEASRSGAGHLAEINRLVNKVRYVADRGGDTWETPTEFFRTGGDCEEYVIAKYLLLRKVGVPDSSLRMLVLRDQGRQTGHAVLLVKTGHGGIVLDNERDDPYPYAASMAGSLAYAFNNHAMWLSLGLPATHGLASN